ncbi:MAG: Lrp/AsnC family transcriptional regulator [Hyphomicrobiales bacterium]|nr:Lrp/AsnC family transcriptional regulator [Hyphomicrobiales bacterium]MBV8824264.1 Lrp/AsnC family transcriptional regulator [Hyphomicrobiales bacterium]MBV9428580.1 Lrp/AsnC family transcriptional regulator [Bradyrhizobiaceae bacterium]
MKGGLVDEIDRRLVALLLENARQPTATLAKQLGIARTTVQDRLERLERRRIIAGYSVVLAEEPSCAAAQSVVLISIVQRDQRAVIERLKKYPEVKLCSVIDGDFDLLLAIESPQNEDIDAVVEEIVRIPGVERSKTIMVLSTKFDRRVPLTPPADLRSRPAGSHGKIEARSA